MHLFLEIQNPFRSLQSLRQVKSLCRFFARKLTFIARSTPSWWVIGLTVLLEKIAGIALVNKLHPILLFEADSNMFNSYVFGQRAMEMAWLHNLIPQEQNAQSDRVTGKMVPGLRSFLQISLDR
jgi:hypothetical protein